MYDLWVSSDKAKQVPAFDVVKDAKYKYELAVRDATWSYENRFIDDLYDRLLAKDMTKFWKVWSAKTCKNVTSVKCMDSKTNNEDIANVFSEKLSSVDATFHYHIPNFNSISINGEFIASKLSVEKVDKVISQRIKNGKAAGYDNLSVGHLTFCHPSSVHHLSKLFNLCLIHGYVSNGL